MMNELSSPNLCLLDTERFPRQRSATGPHGEEVKGHADMLMWVRAQSQPDSRVTPEERDSLFCDQQL